MTVAPPRSHLGRLAAAVVIMGAIAAGLAVWQVAFAHAPFNNVQPNIQVDFNASPGVRSASSGGLGTDVYASA